MFEVIMSLIMKRGDSVNYLAVIPDTFPDGYFTNWSVASQIRTAQYDILVTSLTCTWADPLTTRNLLVTEIVTTDWKLGKALIDIQFVRDSDGFTLSTNTLEIEIVRDITHPDTVV
jgi:hypothetical protein